MFYRSLVKYVLHHIQQGVCRHNDACLQVTELVLQFMLFEQGATRAHNGAQLLDAEMGDDILRTVLQEQRDRITFFNPKAVQPEREAIAQAVELRIGQTAAVPDVGSLVGLRTSMLAQIPCNGFSPCE